MSAPPPSRSDLRALVGHRVRVLYDMGGRDGDPPAAEGRVAAVCFQPMLLVEDDAGTGTWVNSAMPIELMEWRALE